MTRISLTVVVLFISSIGWGLTWIPIKYLAEQGIAGLELILYAFGAAALVFSPLMIWQFPQWQRQWFLMFLIMIFGGLANLTFQLAIVYGDVIRVMILFYLLPVWSVVGARLFLRETIDRLRVMSVLMAILGAMLILNGPSQIGTGFSGVDLLALVAGFTFAMNNLVFRATESVPILSKVAAMFVGVLLLVLIYIYSQGVVLRDYHEIDLGLPLLYGLGWIAVITFATQWGVTHIEAGRASVIIVMELVAAVVSAALWYQQVLSPIEIVGALLVVTAAVMEGRREESSE